MTPQKKFFIFIGVLAIVTVCTMGLGIFNDGKEKPSLNKNEAKETSEKYKWPGLINKITGGLSPTVKKSDILYKSKSFGKYTFNLKQKEGASFRALKIKVVQSSDNTRTNAVTDYYYNAGESDIEFLKIQNDKLKYNHGQNNSNDKYPQDTSLTIFEKGGILKITPYKGSKVIAIIKDKEVMLCQQTLNGTYTYNKNLR